jgi:hypothetical protein
LTLSKKQVYISRPYTYVRTLEGGMSRRAGDHGRISMVGEAPKQLNEADMKKALGQSNEEQAPNWIGGLLLTAVVAGLALWAWLGMKP